MQTNIWGPAMWMSIHVVSFNYPVEPSIEQKKTYSKWLVNTGNILPCKYCRENFEKNMSAAGWRWNDTDANIRDIMKSRHTFSHFCWKLHNNVNEMLGKKSLEFETIRDMYESMRASCLTDEEKTKLELESKELGCIRPLHKGKRGKCVISIVPVSENAKTLSVHHKCLPQ